MKRWAQNEIDKMLELSKKGFSDLDISLKIGRTSNAVKFKRHQFFTKQISIWSIRELEVLEKNYCNNKSYKELTNLLPSKNYGQIRSKVARIGLRRRNYFWKKKEIKLLIELYPYRVKKELLNIFTDKTYGQIKKKAYNLGLKRTKETVARCWNTTVDKLPAKPRKETKWRLAILKRDKNMCQECCRKLKRIELEAHHIIPIRIDKSKKNNIKNGICLCIKCHKKINGNEYKYKNKFQSIIGR